MPVEIITNKEQFNNILETNQYSIIYYGKTNCPPCNIISPLYETLVNKYTDVKFYKIVLDTLESSLNLYLKYTYNLTKLPCFILFNNTNVLDKLINPNIDAIEDLLKTVSGNDEF
jgi:thiol-disulfide isomerase/thioredoxin